MKYLLLLSILVFNFNLFSQTNTNTKTNEDFGDNLDEYLAKKFHAQTFLLEQFIDRFNFDEAIIVDDNLMDRKQNVFYLLNLEDSLLIQNAIQLGFVDTFGSIDKNRIQIDIDSWYSEVVTEFNYKNKPLVVKLYLKLVKGAERGYSWQIFDVESNIFSSAIIEQPTKIINPANNEVYFSELSKFLSNSVDVLNFYSNGLSYNALSSFRDYVQNRDIVFSHITEVKYQFLNIAGFDFTVSKFLRMDMNSGWLISSLKSVNYE
jgi:hypothetical protein